VSRVFGLVRERAVAHFLGVGMHADVLATALRGPNLLQNLLGEQALSASFIPVYTRLCAEGKRDEAGRLAGAVFGLLTVVAALWSLLGITLARPFVTLIAAGFLRDARFELAVSAVRYMFPMTGFLLVSAWALGVLNSHRKFLLPYLAPVAWNACIIGAVWWLRGGDKPALLQAACVGALCGGALQFFVQLPSALSSLGGLTWPGRDVPGLRAVLSALGPAVAGRGVLQLSAYLDIVLASLLNPGAVAALAWAQRLYMLPISLFGMSIAAAELPDLSAMDPSARARFQERVGTSLTGMLRLVVPSTVAYLALGPLVVGGLYRSGDFGADAQHLVTAVLAGYALGLPASAASRLLQNAYYALGDTKTPAVIAAKRVGLSLGVAVATMFWLDRFAIGHLSLGALGLALGASAGAWYEVNRLLCALPRLQRPPVRGFILCSVAAAALAALVWWALPSWHVLWQAAVVLPTYAAAYLLGVRTRPSPQAPAGSAGT
jgi:putative peptidoglycan lipid II flippase